MVQIDVAEMDYQTVNNILQTVPDACELMHCCGQRFIGAGMSDRDILIRGTPGNAGKTSRGSTRSPRRRSSRERPSCWWTIS